MKKIVGIIGAAAVLASSVFAVDLAARVYMTGEVVSGSSADGSNVELFKLKSADQKDADALVLSANLDNAGAQFQFWYKYDGTDGMQNLSIRSANLWFKPIDQIKITVGDLSVGTLKEQLHWWKDPIGANYGEAKSWAGKYSSYATVEAAGVNIDVTPIDGLLITAGIAPGADNAWITFSDPISVLAYGVGATYNLQGATDLPITIAASWRDAGKGDTKVLAIGGSYGSAWSDGFYGMLNARFNIGKNDHTWWSSDNEVSFRGVALDNYFKYTAGAFVAELRAPVIIRFSGNDDDPSYMEFSARVKYALDGFTPYFLFGSDLDNDGEIAFNDTFGDDFNIELKPGVQCNVGACSIDIAALVSIGRGPDRVIGWSVPFELSVAF
ncbi:MAG: hypothetical protein IJ672_01760 [Methanobrevibacter sp.]|nr:hypothetical protein [Methanobrevibacter sp.]